MIDREDKSNQAVWWFPSSGPRIPAIVIKWSASRKRVYIRYRPATTLNGVTAFTMSSYVKPTSITARSAENV